MTLINHALPRTIMQPNFILLMRAACILLFLLASVACKRTPVTQPTTPIPFHPNIRFQAYDLANGAPSDMSFQVSPITQGAQTRFLKLGETVAGTTVRLTDFDAAAEQLVVTDTATKQTARLSLPKPVDAPPTF